MTPAKKQPVESTLGTYASSTYGKELFVSKAKIGKTVALVGSALGAFPWQQNGGVVDQPQNLHVMTFDAAALDGALDFLVKQCGAHKDIANARVYNLQQAAMEAFTRTSPYDGGFPARVYEELYKVKAAASKGGVHVVIISSVTLMAKAWLRSISGPAFAGGGTMMKSAMDQNKWNLFKQQMAEFQWQCQTDLYHTLWEAHHGERSTKDDSSGMPSSMDTLQVDGSTSRTFPANVERIWEIKRTANPAKNEKGQPYNKSLHEVWFDPFPRFDFGDIQTGRKVSGRLEPREPDLTVAFHKLGLKTGHWGT